MQEDKNQRCGLRVTDHPILAPEPHSPWVKILVDGKEVSAREGENLAGALLAAGIDIFRYTAKRKEPRGVFCAIGRCTDCVMVVDGVPNVRTCVTPVRSGMIVETQQGFGHWRGSHD